jgi:hypothetical protein
MKYLYFSFLFLFYSLILCGQNSFLVGSDAKSIEPDSSMFSLALAGYGEPSEGRFTIEWTFYENLPELNFITGIGDHLYGIDKSGNVVKSDLKKEETQWTIIGNQESGALLAGLSSNSFKLLSGFDNKLFAITLENYLYFYDYSNESNGWVKWVKVPDAKAITSANEKLFIVTPNDSLMEGTFSEEGLTWKMLGESKPEVLSITSNNNNLILVTKSQRIWKCNLAEEEYSWKKIGYFNEETFSDFIRHFAVINNKLYGVNLKNELYVSRNASEGELSVRSIVIGDGNSKVVIISLDLCTIDQQLTSAIKKEINEATNIPISAILINVTHTHFAPLSRNWYSFGELGISDKRFNKRIKLATLDATLGAIEKMEESKLFFGRTKSFIGFNRSLKAKNIDNSLDIIKIESIDGELNNVIFLSGCHPVFPNKGKTSYIISPNYPGIARDFVVNQASAKTSVFLQGCGGDINPKLNDYVKTGEILGAEVVLGMEEPMNQIKGNISFALDSLHIKLNLPNKQEIIKIRNHNSDRTGDLNAEMFVRWSDLYINRIEDKELLYAPVYIQTINIGNWKLIGLSREPVNRYSSAIKELFPQQKVSVIGYSNDVSSYLPDSVHISERTYEGHDSFFWYGMPGIFPANIDKQIVEAIKSNNR